MSGGVQLSVFQIYVCVDSSKWELLANRLERHSLPDEEQFSLVLSVAPALQPVCKPRHADNLSVQHVDDSCRIEVDVT